MFNSKIGLVIKWLARSATKEAQMAMQDIFPQAGGQISCRNLSDFEMFEVPVWNMGHIDALFGNAGFV